jgi:chemotaxis protein CheZ
MQKNVIEELKEVTKALAESPIGEANYRELNDRLATALADVVKQIENVRKSLMDVRPGLVDSSQALPQTAGHLGDIDKTLADAAERLFTLTEKAIADNEKSAELLAALKAKAHASEAEVDALASINAESRSELMEVLTSLSFQDLAGQKIKKISALIEDVETRILKILVVLGCQESEDASKQDTMLSELNKSEGGGALKQNLVDDILKQFGL